MLPNMYECKFIICLVFVCILYAIKIVSPNYAQRRNSRICFVFLVTGITFSKCIRHFFVKQQRSARKLVKIKSQIANSQIS